VMREATDVEIWMRKAAMVLNVCRQYCLEAAGEDSPIAKKIDELVDRPPAPKEEESPEA
jgi:hypothetical protein